MREPTIQPFSQAVYTPENASVTGILNPAKMRAATPLVIAAVRRCRVLLSPCQPEYTSGTGAMRRSSARRCRPPFPTYQQLPVQSTMPDPFLYLKYTTTDNAAGSSSFASDVMTGKDSTGSRPQNEWYKCRQPELLQLLQEYQFGYYPDHSQEKVEATRSGNTVQISVTAGGKTGKFKATVSLPSGATSSKPAPVVIIIGGMQNAPYLSAGIAVAQFDYTSVAADSNSKTGAFWDIYKGRISVRSCLLCPTSG